MKQITTKKKPDGLQAETGFAGSFHSHHINTIAHHLFPANLDLNNTHRILSCLCYGETDQYAYDKMPPVHTLQKFFHSTIAQI